MFIDVLLISGLVLYLATAIEVLGTTHWWITLGLQDEAPALAKHIIKRTKDLFLHLLARCCKLAAVRSAGASCSLTRVILFVGLGYLQHRLLTAHDAHLFLLTRASFDWSCWSLTHIIWIYWKFKYVTAAFFYLSMNCSVQIADNNFQFPITYWQWVGQFGVWSSLPHCCSFGRRQGEPWACVGWCSSTKILFNPFWFSMLTRSLKFIYIFLLFPIYY